MMDAMQPKTPDAILAGLNQHGASIGAKKVCFICLVFKFILFSFFVPSPVGCFSLVLN